MKINRNTFVDAMIETFGKFDRESVIEEVTYSWKSDGERLMEERKWAKK
jgi:hypothetical protein